MGRLEVEYGIDKVGPTRPEHWVWNPGSILGTLERMFGVRAESVLIWLSTGEISMFI